MTDWAELIRTKRQELGEKQADFAKRLGISQQHLSRLEMGTHPVFWEVKRRFAQEFRGHWKLLQKEMREGLTSTSNTPTSTG